METYEMAALALRWWFIALLGVILLRLVFSMLRDRLRQPEQIEKAAGYSIGLLEIVYPENSRLMGRRFPLGRENRAGSSSVCEARIKSRGIKGVHCVITRQGGRTMLSPCGARLYLNGALVLQSVELADGDYIGFGGFLLRLRLASIDREPRRAAVFEQGGDAYLDCDDYDESYAEYMGAFEPDSGYSPEEDYEDEFDEPERYRWYDRLLDYDGEDEPIEPEEDDAYFYDDDEYDDDSDEYDDDDDDD